MVFLDKLDRGADFDNEIFRKYTTTGGDKFDYLVWPAMLLHQGGQIIAQGIAQPIRLLPDIDDDDDVISNNSGIAPRQTPGSRARHSRISRSRAETINAEPEGQKIIPQTPPKVYKRAPSRDEDLVPSSPFFNPHSARAPNLPSKPIPRGTSCIPAISENDRGSRYGGFEGGYQPDQGNLTVAWKNRKEDRLPSAP